MTATQVEMKVWMAEGRIVCRATDREIIGSVKFAEVDRHDVVVDVNEVVPGVTTEELPLAFLKCDQVIGPILTYF